MGDNSGSTKIKGKKKKKRKEKKRKRNAETINLALDPISEMPDRNTRMRGLKKKKQSRYILVLLREKVSLPVDYFHRFTPQPPIASFPKITLPTPLAHKAKTS